MISRRSIALAFVCGLIALAAAGESATVLGAPSFDHATETTYRALTWSDFKGRGTSPPGWSRWHEGSFAHIATTLRVNRYEIEDRQVGDEWLAKASNFRAYAVMNKDFSAVKHGSRNAYTLDHEQLHFDISEAFARGLSVRLAATEGRGSTRAEAHADLTRKLQQGFDAGMQEMWELQGRYDGETDNGQRKKKQKKWAKEVPEMFREATEALIALQSAQQ